MVATHYSFKDRVFIVGDACHTHSPKAGQGANASMGDSHNLAWKIAHVLRGWAGKSLLDTYEVERRRFAQELIASDKYFTEVLDGKTALQYQDMLHKLNMSTSGVGILYESRLITDTHNAYALTLRAGERIPPSPLIRLGDWQPMDLQDLAPSDGLFKLFIFPCDILLPSQAEHLSQFADALEESIDAQTVEMISLYTILSSPKERVHWKDVPPNLQSWKRVFVSEDVGIDGAYKRLGITPEGAAILVRPDGYISTITGLSSESACDIIKFLQEL